MEIGEKFSVYLHALVLPSQFNLLNMLSNVAVNSLGEMVSPCLTPLLILIFSLSVCRCTVTELSVYMSLRTLFFKLVYGMYVICWFVVKCGFRQGCVPSPLLFIIFMDNIMKRANLEENNIEELMFADRRASE